jgi:putative hydrolase of the HAD superfamily
MKSKSPFSQNHIIAFDADDTLWHNEPLFSTAQQKFKALLATYHSEEWISQKLYETEVRNLAHFGYGVKGFTLSMIETAVELTEGRISGTEIQQVIGFAKEMVRAPVILLDGVLDVISHLVADHRLMIITKGDLFDQESKIARSGLAEYFEKVEIASEKDNRTYDTIVKKHEIDPRSFIMVGNSVRSDILPVLEIGGQAVHIPYETTWAHERIIGHSKEKDYVELRSIRQLPELIKELGRRRASFLPDPNSKDTSLHKEHF